MMIVWVKPSSIRNYLPTHFSFFIVLTILWIFISLINGKMHRGKITNLTNLFLRVLSSNLIAVAIAALLMYSIREYSYSRTIVFGTVIIATFLELLAGMAFIAVKRAVVQDSDIKVEGIKRFIPDETEMVGTISLTHKAINSSIQISNELFSEIKNESGEAFAEGIKEMIGSKAGKNHALVSTGTVLNIFSLPQKEYHYIINLRTLNQIKNLNGFLDAVNSKLRHGGFFLCCVETKNHRKKKILEKYPYGLNFIVYMLDFVINRVMPKLRLTRKIWLLMTGGRNCVISRAEALGRLCRAGFKINREAFIEDKLCIEAYKEGVPLRTVNNNYGLLIALSRLGKEGREIKVYKLRTMHPYSEYIQDYIYSLHNLKEGGKFENDFRVTSWGVLCRKVWLDELPMLINLIKGDLKIVGVRPLSRQYFNLYSRELQERRIKYKPGLIPPFYADLPSTLEEIQESEIRYLDEYDKKPFLTDLKYFFRSVWNILIHNVRSN